MAKVREAPRISVNKLAEYLGARAGRRRAIIIDQKYPPDFKVAYYTEAQNAIVGYLVSQNRDERILTRAIDQLLAVQPQTEWQSRKVQVCVDAIEAFLEFGPDLEFDGLGVQAGTIDQPDLLIGNVSVSVRPEMIVRKEGRNGTTAIGAVKLCFSKSAALNEEGGAYVGAALRRFVEGRLANGTKCDPTLCTVVDIFAREIHECPKAVKRRFDDMEAACEEIARAWQAY